MLENVDCLKSEDFFHIFILAACFLDKLILILKVFLGFCSETKYEAN